MVEEWIYGEPPDAVQFVRFNNNRVIRVEVAKVGEAPVIRTENEMGDYWQKQKPDNTRIVKLGDQAPPQPGTESAARKPPSLRLPGESLPADSNPATPQMGPVQLPPKDQTPNSGQQQGTPSQSGQPSSTPSQPAPSQSAPPSSGNPFLVAARGGV